MKALAIAALLFLLGLEEGTAFELERVNDDPCSGAQNLFWNPARARLDPTPLSPPRFQDLAFQAASRWNESVFVFRFDSGSGAFCDMQDGVVAMGFDTRSCGGAPLGDAVAVTVTRFESRTGKLLDANVIFDADEPAFVNPSLFLEVAMHELGHVLGLDHSDACGKSGEGTLMKAQIPLGGPRLDRPQADDIAGVNFIYGEAFGGSPELGDGSCRVARRDESPAPWPSLFLPGVFVLLRKKGRRNVPPRACVYGAPPWPPSRPPGRAPRETP
ncbi:MAG: hypothetical protein KatS3mg076_1103 [Candidatus Binatia bacterium]|nr:MAG: hypothetical protein KatS3mg076_1103 [Candidatus Binatia bacterium]